LLEETLHYLEAPSGQIEMAFPYFIAKKAPVSGAESLMDYRAAIRGNRRLGKTDLWLKVTVPVTSLCPCSKSISAYGAHNQRAHITITAKIDASIWFEDLIGMEDPVNVPGTDREYPNWQRKLTVDVEDLETRPDLDTLFADLSRARG